jgi:CheY-like chemotaxis protein
VSEPLPLVLVVDDTPETRRLMRRVLERDRLRVVEAGSGEEALERIISLRPAVVVLDLRLPVMSGFDVARRVRAHADPAIARTVLLACSASLQTEVIEAALEAGCDDFEGKPFDVLTFASRVRAVMADGRHQDVDAGARVAPAD